MTAPPRRRPKIDAWRVAIAPQKSRPIKNITPEYLNRKSAIKDKQWDWYFLAREDPEWLFTGKKENER